mgnify:CR=1 FL=1|jgi:hypothetical protein
MAIRKFTVSLTTDASGDVTAYTPYLSGLVQQVIYTKTDFADGVDFTITVEGTGETVWTESNVNAAVAKLPRAATHSTAGVALLYAAGGAAVADQIAIGRDRIKCVIAQGGNAKTGTLTFLINDGR